MDGRWRSPVPVLAYSYRKAPKGDRQVLRPHPTDELSSIVFIPYALRRNLGFNPGIFGIEDVLLNAFKDIGLAVNTGKIKSIKVGRNRGVIANAHIKIGSNSYEKVKTFKYLGSLLTNQNFIQEEMTCRLKARNSCYYSIQTLVF